MDKHRRDKLAMRVMTFFFWDLLAYIAFIWAVVCFIKGGCGILAGMLLVAFGVFWIYLERSGSLEGGSFSDHV